MALVAAYLVDTSAAARASHPQVASFVAPLVSGGLVGTCAALDFEALFSSRSASEYEEMRLDRRLSYEYLPTNNADWERALDVQRQLALKSQLRAVGMPDLLIAAVAERERVTIVHYDSDFDIIAAVTGQSAQWVAPRGSL
ncbi:MAG TPA: PIN domain nuclease [Galbitalea sp.]